MVFFKHIFKMEMTDFFNLTKFDIEYEIVRIVFAMIGTIFISIGMSTIFSFTVELFPTSIRSISMGICSTCGRIGSVLAPILANVSNQMA